MSVLHLARNDTIDRFKSGDSPMAVVDRCVPEGFADFARLITVSPFRVISQVSAEDAEQDIKALLRAELEQALCGDPLFETWVDDMAHCCRLFAGLLGTSHVGFCLGTERGCTRYHVDHVPYRLLVTYAGTGTEWLPNHAVDRNAWANGAANDDIVLDASQKQFVDPWDITLFRGGKDGILHRTPDAAQNKRSILMRLDHPAFWEHLHPVAVAQ